MTSASINQDKDWRAPRLNGLILAGGKSMRMGRDKGGLEWHGKAQRYYMADLLKNFCADVYISCREEQQNQFDPNYKYLPDQYENIGPTGGILTAFKTEPNQAWLVVACDLPLVDAAILSELIASRDPTVTATTYRSPHDGSPEPLITIWEPCAYPMLLERLAEGQRCPRKALINNKIKMIEVKDEKALLNANTPADLEVLNKISNLKISADES